jgi:hypothetical protein
MGSSLPTTLLSVQNIESELSYAYLHAVASKAGVACHVVSRHDDNNGVDAQLTAKCVPAAPGHLSEVSLNVQLKATKNPPVDDGETLSYFLSGVKQYNALRAETLTISRILVVLFLPNDETEWLHHTAEEMVLRRCAYWRSLRGAPATANVSGETIRFPKTNVFSPETLTSLVLRLSRRDIPTYEKP